MKKLFLTALALLSFGPSALAATVIDASNDTTVTNGPASNIMLTLATASATRLFDALTVRETPGWEDVQISSKSAAGIYCNNEDAPAGRYASCQIQVNAQKGIEDAALTGRAEKIALSFTGTTAAKIYGLLDVPAKQEDAEGYTYSKVLPGISCQEHTITKSNDCVIYVDAAQGVLR